MGYRLSLQKMDSLDQVQILDEAVCVLNYINALGKDTNIFSHNPHKQ